jgi:hypothetical protein
LNAVFLFGRKTANLSDFQRKTETQEIRSHFMPLLDNMRSN